MYKLKNVETYDNLLDFLRDETEFTEGSENNIILWNITNMGRDSTVTFPFPFPDGIIEVFVTSGLDLRQSRLNG